MNKLIQACAFILADHGFDTMRLLTFQVMQAGATDYYHTHLHIPTGNIHQDQTPEDALYESIYRRTGIPKANLDLVRKIGISSRYRMTIDTTFIRHEYVLELTTPYPETWKQAYQRSMNDSEDLKIQMITPAQLPQVNAEYRDIIEKQILEFTLSNSDV